MPFLLSAHLPVRRRVVSLNSIIEILKSIGLKSIYFQYETFNMIVFSLFHWVT